MSHDFINCKGTSHGKTVTKGEGGHLMKEAIFCPKRRVLRGEVHLYLSFMLISGEKFTII
jgi:hypothetical protein